jgi:hypothetical protein
MNPDEPVRPYASAALAYSDAQWSPIPIQGKFPPPTGWTGHNAPYPSNADIYAWAEEYGDRNLGLRLPVDILGLDIDAYPGKHGAATLMACEAMWGVLPPTWRSSARSDGISGIRLYRVPIGVAWLGQLPGGDCETVHSGHRYCMAWPSINPSTGTVYRWHDDTKGVVSLHLPTPAELPILPWQWVIGLTKGQYSSETKDFAERAWAEEISNWPGSSDPDVCAVLQTSRDAILYGLAHGSRHDTLLDPLLDLVRKGEQAHHGILCALRDIEEAFIASVTADKSRTLAVAHAEFDRSVDGALALVRGMPSWPKPRLDPCTLREDGTYPEPVESGSESILGRSTWLPRLDLDATIRGEHSEEPPTELARLDGQSLWYPGRVNGLIGPSESGKSWIAFEAMRQAMNADKYAWLLDFEDSLPAAVERLRTLGVSDDLMRDRFLYSDPSQTFGPNEAALVAETLDKYKPALVILDGTNAAMSATGYDLMSNVDATKFYQNVLRPLTASKAAVVSIDHTPKNDNDRESMGGIGAQAKRAMTDGCSLRVEVTQEFGRGQMGNINLWVDKDRPGYVRGKSNGKLAGRITVAPGEPLIIAIAAPPLKADEPFKPTTIMDRILRYLALENAPISANKIQQSVTGKRAYVLAAIKELESEGSISSTNGPNGALWSLA